MIECDRQQIDKQIKGETEIESRIKGETEIDSDRM